MSNASRRRNAAARQQSPRPAAAAVSAPVAAAPVSPALPLENVFSLDAIAHEAISRPFPFEAHGKMWYLRSPESLNWLEHSVAVQFAVMDDLRPFLREVLGKQYDEFVKLPISLGQMWALIRRWQRHYGITLPESSASLRS